MYLREKRKSLEFLTQQRSDLQEFICEMEDDYGNIESYDPSLRRVFNALRQNYFDNLTVEYSLGYKKTDLTFDWDNYFKAFKFSLPKSNYSHFMEASSVAVLFDASADDLSILTDEVTKAKMLDPLLEKLLSAEGQSQIKSPDKVITLLVESTYNGGDSILLEKYLNEWYALNEGEYWHNEHLESDRSLFYGYWSFEAAAIFKKYFSGEAPSIEYFPRDLVT